MKEEGGKREDILLFLAPILHKKEGGRRGEKKRKLMCVVHNTTEERKRGCVNRFLFICPRVQGKGQECLVLRLTHKRGERKKQCLFFFFLVTGRGRGGKEDRRECPFPGSFL